MKLKKEKLPQHVALIMDGNRRWARSRGLPPLAGHQKAANETIEPLVDKAIELGIPYLTLWAFSTENWRREKREVEGLLNLFRRSLSKNMQKLHQKGVRLRTIGDLRKFPQDIQERLRKGLTKTKNNQKITLVFALNYGGRNEIIRAINKWRSSPKSKIQNPKLTEAEFERYLDTAGMPDPDLIIRTGGERRLSGFLLWQGTYSELYFSEVLFPDFTPEEFEKAIFDYQKRQRRFGR